jgi:IS30 family transposase
MPECTQIDNQSRVSLQSRRSWLPPAAGTPQFDQQKEDGPPRITPETWTIIEAKICLEWSPEQISGRLKHEEGIHISHKWIYQHIYKDKRNNGDLHRHLRC